jgi:hypothetical protein
MTMVSYRAWVFLFEEVGVHIKGFYNGSEINKRETRR